MKDGAFHKRPPAMARAHSSGGIEPDFIRPGRDPAAARRSHSTRARNSRLRCRLREAADAPRRTSARLYVCTTCVRDLRLAPGESSRGQRLADERHGTSSARTCHGSADPTAALSQGALPQRVPESVQRGAPRLGKMRFRRLVPEDAGAILEFASAYLEHSTGDVPDRNPGGAPRPAHGEDTTAPPAAREREGNGLQAFREVDSTPTDGVASRMLEPCPGKIIDFHHIGRHRISGTGHPALRITKPDRRWRE